MLRSFGRSFFKPITRRSLSVLSIAIVIEVVSIPVQGILPFFLSYVFVVGASGMLWTGGSVSGSVRDICRTNQIGSTIKHQSNFLL